MDLVEFEGGVCERVNLPLNEEILRRVNAIRNPIVLGINPNLIQVRNAAENHQNPNEENVNGVSDSQSEEISNVNGPADTVRLKCYNYNMGYCKFRRNCARFHPTQDCPQKPCYDIFCQKRHRIPCKFVLKNGSCKFRKKCEFLHEAGTGARSKRKTGKSSNAGEQEQSNVSSSRQSNVSSSRQGNVSSSRPSNVSSSRQDNVSSSIPNNISSSRRGNVSISRPSNVSSSREGNVSSSRPSNVSSSRPSNVSSSRQGNVSSSRLSNVSSSRQGNVSSLSPSNVSSSRQREVSSSKDGNIERKMEEDIKIGLARIKELEDKFNADEKIMTEQVDNVANKVEEAGSGTNKKLEDLSLKVVALNNSINTLWKGVRKLRNECEEHDSNQEHILNEMLAARRNKSLPIQKAEPSTKVQDSTGVKDFTELNKHFGNSEFRTSSPVLFTVLDSLHGLNI